LPPFSASATTFRIAVLVKVAPVEASMPSMPPCSRMAAISLSTLSSRLMPAEG